MATGCIPRFSPSFSSREMRTTLRTLLHAPDDAEAVGQFEANFASFIGCRHAIMVPSARFGFYLLLEAYGIGEGDEVILPALTYFVIPGMVMTRGCTPVFADTHPTSYTLDPEAFRAAITPQTRAVVPTHLFGIPADLSPILEIAKEHNIVVIEDCAQATGATYRVKHKYKPVGSFGDAAYYTFGLTKNMTTLKGAMVTTDDDSLAASLRGRMSEGRRIPRATLLKEALVGTAMRVATHPMIYPWTVHPAVRLGNAMGQDPIHDRFGEEEHVEKTIPERYFNARPTSLQAAIGRSQLGRIELLNGQRMRNGRFLDEHLTFIPELTRPTWPEDAQPIFMSYVIQHPRREQLADRLRRRGVDTTYGYMTDASTNPLFATHHRPCPNATKAMSHLLHLPVHPNLTSNQLHHMAESVRLVCLEMER